MRNYITEERRSRTRTTTKDEDDLVPIPFRVAVEICRESGPLTSVELFLMPTEDYPGPTRSHPEKEDKNDPARPAGVTPVRPPMPEAEEPPLQEEDEEE